MDYFFLFVCFTYLTGEWRHQFTRNEDANFYKCDFRARLGPWTIGLLWNPVKEPKVPIYNHQLTFQFRSTTLIKSGGKLLGRGLVG